MGKEEENSGKRPCSFCSINGLSNGFFRLHETFGLPYPADQIPILQSDHFIVKPDILPLESNGLHALIIPTSHHDGKHPLSFAQLSSYVDEVGHLIQELESTWNVPILLAEHGANKEGSNHQSVYHAHTHAFGIPDGTDALTYMEEELRRRGISFYTLDHVDPSTPDNLKKAYQGVPYLYVQCGRQAIIAHDREGKFPSQITQGAMSRLFNNGEILNWKQIGLKGEKNPHVAQLAVERTMKLLTKCIY